MNTYTHNLSLNIYIQAATRAEADQKFADLDFRFNDCNNGESYDYDYVEVDVICFEPRAMPKSLQN